MKPSTKAIVLMLAGSVLMLIGVFSKPLEVPSSVESVPILAAVVLIYLGYRVSKRATDSSQLTPLTEVQRRKRFRLLAGACAVARAATPFLVPLTGVSLPFGKMVFVSIISFVLCLGAMWFGLKLRK